jgi:hypothetical protein
VDFGIHRVPEMNPPKMSENKCIGYTFCSCVDGYLSRFHTLIVMNNASLNVAVQMSLLHTDFITFEYIERDR